MRNVHIWLAPRLLLAMLILASLAFTGAAFAQDPDDEPDPEFQALDDDEEFPPDAVDEDEEEDEDEDQVSEVADDQDTDDFEAFEVADFIDELDIDDDGSWEAVPMTDDENWAPPLDLDESDDAIHLDHTFNPTGEDWDVVDMIDSGGETEEVVAAPTGDTNRWSSMPVLRKPAPGTKPASTTGQDVPYSTGGKPVGDQGVPWQAQIYYPFSSDNWAADLKKGVPLWSLQHECGGTLIDKDWVLTAAHCIDEDMVKKGYRVRLGAKDLSRNDGMTFKIDRIVRHSQYAGKGQPENGPTPSRPNMYANDIALIHIVDDGPPRPRDPAKIRPIPLHEGPVSDGTPVSATGWGKTEAVDNYQRSAVMMRVDLQVMDTKRCALLPTYGPEKIHGAVICAANAGRSTCAGDSGGAITPTNGAAAVVGIVSWGKGRCTGDGQPGVYTRVASYRNWIAGALKLDPHKNALP